MAAYHEEANKKCKRTRHVEVERWVVFLFWDGACRLRYYLFAMQYLQEERAAVPCKEHCSLSAEESRIKSMEVDLTRSSET